MENCLPEIAEQSVFNDCFLIALQNYTGKSQAEIYSAVRTSDWSVDLILRYGTPYPVIERILTTLGIKFEVKRARRGQWKLSGIAIWHKPGKAHATALMNGVVLDTRKNYCTIPEYRAKHEWSLKMVYSFQVCVRG